MDHDEYTRQQREMTRALLEYRLRWNATDGFGINPGHERYADLYSTTTVGTPPHSCSYADASGRPTWSVFSAPRRRWWQRLQADTPKHAWTAP